MPWVRYDDNVRNHPKVEALDDATYRLWREAIEWCAQNLTDGLILARQLGLTSIRASATRARKLVEQSLWHRAGSACDSERCPPSSGVDGWVIHDYWDYQPTREKVREEQAAAAERKRRWLERKKNGDGNTVPNGVTDGRENVNPAPPRPAPKGRGGLRPPAPPAAVGGVAAAVGDGQSGKPHASAICPTCGNPPTSAYHRHSCRADLVEREAV
jgi:hypothetical protein